MKKKNIVIKRPLCMTCLILIVILFVIVKLRGIPVPLYPPGDDKTVTLEGRVTKKEGNAADASLVLYLRVNSEKKPLSVICYLSPGQSEPELGSRVRVQGKWEAFEKATNPGQFDSYIYYQVLGISYRLFQTKILAKTTTYNFLEERLYQIKCRMADALQESLPEREAAVMRTMLLGEKGAMDKDLKELYQRNGIAHILAISGLHITLLGMGLMKLLQRIGIPMAISGILATVILVLYGIMIGFSPSACRAIMMFLLSMLAKLCKRTYDRLTALALAAAFLLLENPLYFYHTGFVFSFGTILGISVVMPILKFENARLQALLGGVTMSVITLPIYLWYFYQVPIYSVLINLLVIPIMSLLMLAGMCIIPAWFLCHIFTLPFADFICGALQLYEKACLICEQLPGYLYTPGKPALWQMLSYFAIFMILACYYKKLKPILRWGVVFIAVILLLIRPGRTFSVTALDVGQGDCIFIQNKSKECYLIDGGSSTASDTAKYIIIPFLKYRGAARLKAIIVTHADADHCNGIADILRQGRLQGITVENLILPDVVESTMDKGYQELVQLAEENGIPVCKISRGMELRSKGMTLTCLHPTVGYETANANEYSTVLLLKYGYFRALLTGDIEGAGERAMQEYYAKLCAREQSEESFVPISVLKVAHHGSANSTSEKLLKMISPRYAIISCGKRNTYGHPHAELLERLEKYQVKIENTTQTGAVTFIINGKELRVNKFIP